jgi:S13-like H2TH domain
MALPTLSPEQRELALAKAAAARNERSAALAAVKNGSMDPADFLATTSEVLKRTKVRQVILAVPGVGKVRAARLMEEAQIDPRRRVAGLGANQRQKIADLLAV